MHVAERNAWKGIGCKMGNCDNKNYEIYIDVSVDLDTKFLEENNIHLMKMHYSVGDEQLLYQQRPTDEFLHDFYDKMRGGASSGTSQITPNTYEEVFAEHIQKGEGVLYISLSSGLSNTYASSLLAIENLQEKYESVAVESVDSLAATGGMGLALILAVKNRKQGMTLKENAEFLRSHMKEICHWFMVDDLMFLKRGGRVSATTAIVGSALNVKPVLKIDDDGKLVTISKQRGLAKTVKYMLSNYMEAKDSSLGREVIIVHGDCAERAETLKMQLLEMDPEAQVEVCMLGPVIGAHTGPGMLAIVHFGNRNFA